MTFLTPDITQISLLILFRMILKMHVNLEYIKLILNSVRFKFES